MSSQKFAAALALAGVVIMSTASGQPPATDVPPAFLAVHLADLVAFGYEDSPFEVDARAHEVAARPVAAQAPASKAIAPTRDPRAS